MARDPKGIPIDVLAAVRQELDEMNRRLRRLENNTVNTMQQLTTDDINDPLEGEFIIDYRDHQHTWYSGGEWRRPAEARSLLRTITVCGTSITSTLGTTQTHPIENVPIFEGDGLLVFAIAPQYPSIGAPLGHAISCTDSAGNIYEHLTSMSHQIDPVVPAVNTGYRVEVFWCKESQAVMPLTPSTVTVTWDNPVNNRVVSVFSVTQFGGNRDPILINKTTDHDTGVYAATTVKVTGSFTPTRSRAMTLAFCLIARPNTDAGIIQYVGGGAFMGGVETESGVNQRLAHIPTVYGADVILTTDLTSYFYALGYLPAGVPTPTIGAIFGYNQDGVPQGDRWKSIILLGLT